MSNVTKIYFSPSGTTKDVVDQLANTFGQDGDSYDLLNFNSDKELGSDDIAIVGMPVFAGRIPKTARQRLAKFKGDNTPAIAVVNYGNAHVTDALLELLDILKENNFKNLKNIYIKNVDNFPSYPQSYPHLSSYGRNGLI